MNGRFALRQDALTYLADHQVMTLATSGADGIWAAAVFYVNDDFDLYFLSAGHTRHARHIAQNPQVAATIQEDYASWAEIRGVQCAGKVTQLQGRERQAAIARYRAKYAFLRDAPAPVQAAFTRVNWYRLRSTLLYFIDNSKGFGHRDQILAPD